MPLRCGSLYTSRLVLERLGVDDCSVYSVVGGIVTILQFPQRHDEQRHFTLHKLRTRTRRHGRLHRTFASSMKVHIALAAIVLLLAETAGLWYVNNRLVIDRRASPQPMPPTSCPLLPPWPQLYRFPTLPPSCRTSAWTPMPL